VNFAFKEKYLLRMKVNVFLILHNNIMLFQMNAVFFLFFRIFAKIKLSRTTVFNIDDNNTCLLSSKLAY